MSLTTSTHMSNNESGRKIIAALQVSVDGFIEGPTNYTGFLYYSVL
jgi:hypothetical protein